MDYATRHHLDALVALERSFRARHRADRPAVTTPTRLVGRRRRNVPAVLS